MRVHRCDIWERSRIVWNWDWVKDFPSCLCKELLRTDGEYYVGWADVDDADEFLSLQLRDQPPSRCLTPGGESHALRDVVARLDERGWTFAGLAGDDPPRSELPRNPAWFARCAELLGAFDSGLMGPLAIHPRLGLKHAVGDGDVFDPSAHEIYEGQHRALVLAKKLLEGTAAWQPLRLIYLWPDRPTT